MKFHTYVQQLSEQDFQDFTQLPIQTLVQHWAAHENIPFKDAWIRALGEMIHIEEAASC